MRQGTMGLSSFGSRVSWTHLLFTRGFFHLKPHRTHASKSGLETGQCAPQPFKEKLPFGCPKLPGKFRANLRLAVRFFPTILDWRL